MRKMLLVDIDKCTGCEMCVDICSGSKVGAYSEKASRIRVDRDEIKSVFIPLVCEQCREHPCADICPVGAIRYDESLCIFNINEDTCTGCSACKETCPYHGIFLAEGIAMKCDLCDGEPRCVSVCYPKALQYAEITEGAILDDLQNKISKLKKMGNDFHE